MTRRDVAPPALGAGGRRIFIGDVQGCDDELGDLLGLLEWDPKHDQIWFAGDLVNRGPRSLAALRRARSIATGIVLGNHDLHLLGVAAGQRKLRPGDTLREILEADDCRELLDWLRQQPLLVRWDDLWLVHAGLSPGWSRPEKVARRLERKIAAGPIPFGDPDLQFLTTVRHCTRAGERPRPETPEARAARPWDEFYEGESIVVFGHWAARGLVRGERVRGLDSGCVWGGELSAWIAEEDRFVSVPARRVYQRPAP